MKILISPQRYGSLAICRYREPPNGWRISRWRVAHRNDAGEYRQPHRYIAGWTQLTASVHPQEMRHKRHDTQNAAR